MNVFTRLNPIGGEQYVRESRIDVADRVGDPEPKFGTSPNEQYPSIGCGRQNVNDLLFAPVTVSPNEDSSEIKSTLLKKPTAAALKSSTDVASKAEYASAN